MESYLDEIIHGIGWVFGMPRVRNNKSLNLKKSIPQGKSLAQKN